MVPAQTSYSKDTRMALAGLLAYVGNPSDIVSRIAEGVIGFGLAVGRGSGAKDQAVLGLGGGFIGISVRDTAIENDPIGAELQQYPDKKNMAVLREGYIWGKLAAAQTPTVDGAVYFNDTTGEFVTADAAGVSLIDNATFDSNAINGLAIIRLKAPTSTTAGV